MARQEYLGAPDRLGLRVSSPLWLQLPTMPLIPRMLRLTAVLLGTAQGPLASVDAAAPAVDGDLECE